MSTVNANKSPLIPFISKSSARIAQKNQLLKQKLQQQTQNSSKQHPSHHDDNLGFSIQNNYKEKVQQLKRHKQDKLIQSVLESPENTKQSTGKEQAIRKQRQELNQFIYQNQTHIFTISRAKVPNKNQKFIDIQINLKQNGLHFYKITMKNNQIPQNIKKTGIVTANSLFTKLQKFQTSFRMQKDEFIFSTIDKQEEIVDCMIELHKVKLNQDQMLRHKNQLLQKQNRIFQKRLEQERKNYQKQISDLVAQLQNQKQFKNNLLKEIKILRLQKQQNVQNVPHNNPHKKIMPVNNNNAALPLPVNVNSFDNDIQIVPNNGLKSQNSTNANTQHLSIVQICDSDDQVQQICEQRDSYYEDDKKRRASGTKHKKSTKEIQPQINLDFHSNDPYSLVHAVTGQVIHAGQLLKFRSKQQPKQKENYMTLDQFREQGGKPPRATQSISYNQRKSVWKEYARKYKKKQFTQIILNEVGYTETKRLTKTGLELPTMGFLQLFFQLLEIDLSNNNIQHIEGLYNCKKLRKLDLNHNLLTKIQGLQDQRELRELFLRQNQIVKIQGIFHIKKLQSFSLQGNKIDQIPQNISDLQFLRTFYLNHNCLKTLPKSMGNMHNTLKALRLSQNPQLRVQDPNNKFVIDQLRKFGCNVFTKNLFQ